MSTVRYSVPPLVRRSVEVLETEVMIFDDQAAAARHRRRMEPHQRIADPRHFEGLYRQRNQVTEMSISRSAEASRETSLGCRLSAPHAWGS